MSDLTTAMLNYAIISPVTLVGVILGGATVFLFSGLAIDAVTRAAGAIVFEVRRQFRENPGIMTVRGPARVRPRRRHLHAGLAARAGRRPVSWRRSRRSRSASVSVSARSPGFLGGAIATGVLMAVFLANSGGAWDNAKKIVEDGNFGGKGSDAHAAAVIGDTVGDPFKDTAGPAINPLIKVMNLVALLIAPAVVAVSVGDDANTGAAARDRGRCHSDRVRCRHRVPAAGRARRQGRPDARGREAARALTHDDRRRPRVTATGGVGVAMVSSVRGDLMRGKLMAVRRVGRA